MNLDEIQYYQSAIVADFEEPVTPENIHQLWLETAPVVRQYLMQGMFAWDDIQRNSGICFAYASTIYNTCFTFQELLFPGLPRTLTVSGVYTVPHYLEDREVKVVPQYELSGGLSILTIALDNSELQSIYHNLSQEQSIRITNSCVYRMMLDILTAQLDVKRIEQASRGLRRMGKILEPVSLLN